MMGKATVRPYGLQQLLSDPQANNLRLEMERIAAEQKRDTAKTDHEDGK